ncbi:(deoxy)nucleoside triphosphate pyrophosphohydrolase [Corynebacterium caspium]|uniref:(deoxy)nucleoside triphosphate pyrophosphohydrolase n=1 Tax=Corynebacterium caspium TaxID=234828 RepID=UPI00035EC03E|nr:(deoxy)nucleoside triphosphate pyrophosphohydrolase [Corynebacterium caspium]WKD58584.1 CTP pyrophosphohydrolase [Corynebacterium caspium DSM 44850]
MAELLDVVGAVIHRDGLILATRRSRGATKSPGLWEFPGGKIEAQETPQQALAREIAEELRCRVAVGQLVHDGTSAGIRLRTYLCTITANNPELVEHGEFRWMVPADLPQLNWGVADLATVELLATGKIKI